MDYPDSFASSRPPWTRWREVYQKRRAGASAPQDEISAGQDGFSLGKDADRGRSCVAGLCGTGYDMLAWRHRRGKCAAPDRLANWRTVDKPPKPGAGRHFPDLADDSLLNGTCDEMELRAVLGLHERERGMALFYQLSVWPSPMDTAKLRRTAAPDRPPLLRLGAVGRGAKPRLPADDALRHAIRLVEPGTRAARIELSHDAPRDRRGGLRPYDALVAEAARLVPAPDTDDELGIPRDRPCVAVGARRASLPREARNRDIRDMPERRKRGTATSAICPNAACERSLPESMSETR